MKIIPNVHHVNVNEHVNYIVYAVKEKQIVDWKNQENFGEIKQSNLLLLRFIKWWLK